MNIDHEYLDNSIKAFEQLPEAKEEFLRLIASAQEKIGAVDFKKINDKSVIPFINAMTAFEEGFKKISEDRASVFQRLVNLESIQKIFDQFKKTLVNEKSYKGYYKKSHRKIHRENLANALAQLASLQELITEAQPYKAIDSEIEYFLEPEEGHELDFMINKNKNEPLPRHKLQLNPLQYAAHMGDDDAFNKLILAITEDNNARLWLTGQYGVISLAYQSECLEKILPSIIEKFPFTIPLIIKEAADNNHTPIYDMIMSAIAETEHNPFTNTSVALALKGLLSMHAPDYCHESVDQLAEDVSTCATNEMVSKLSELRSYHEVKQLPNVLMMISLLENNRNSLDYLSDKNENLLHMLAQSEHDLPAVAHKILQLTRDLNLQNQTDNDGNLPLHLAVANNQFFTAQLLAGKTKVNEQNSDGNTALHIAASRGNPDMVMMLYAAGCDPFIKNNEGKTAFDIAKDTMGNEKQSLLEKRERLREKIKQLNKLKDEFKDKKSLFKSLAKLLDEYREKSSVERVDNNHEAERKIEAIKKDFELALKEKNELKRSALFIGRDKLIKQTVRELQELNFKLQRQSQTTTVMQSITREFNAEDENNNSEELRKILYAVFKGGGAKGTAHLGAFIKAIEEGYIKLEDLKGVAGTSAGGIFALFVALGFSKEQIKEKLFDLDFTIFLDDSDTEFTKRIIDDIQPIKDLFAGKLSFVGVLSTLNEIKNVLNDFGESHKSGVFKGEAFKNWILSQILEKVKGTDILDNINVHLSEVEQAEYDALNDEEQKQNYMLGKKAALLTFSDFYHHPDLKEIKLFGTDISTRRGEEYSFEKTPDMTVLSAIRITMSLPIIFQPAYIEERILVEEKNGKQYYRLVRASDAPKVDGGYFDNFPINAFDKDGVFNPNVMGFCLVPPEEFFEFARKELPDINYVDENSAGNFLFNMTLSGLFGQQDYYHGQGVDTERTVYLSTYDVGTLELDLTRYKKQKLSDLGGKIGLLDYEGSHRHTLENVTLSHHTRKRLAKYGLRKDFTHNKHIHGRFEPRVLMHPVHVLKLFGKAEESDLKFLRMLVNPNVRDVNHVTALHLAKALNLKDTYDRLVQCQANENAAAKNGLLAKNASWDDIKHDDLRAALPDCLFDENGVSGDEATFKKRSKTKLKEKVARQKAKKSELKNQIKSLKSEKEELQARFTTNLSLEFYQTQMKKNVLQPLKVLNNDKLSPDVQKALQQTYKELEDVLNAPSSLSGKERISELRDGMVNKINDILDGKVEDCKPLLKHTWGVALLKALLTFVVTVCTLGIAPIASKKLRSFLFRPEPAHRIWKMTDAIDKTQQHVIAAPAG